MCLLRTYFKKEFLPYHFKGVGFWVPLVSSVVSLVFACCSAPTTTDTVARKILENLPPWTFATLAVIFAAVSFQWNTFAVDDLKKFYDGHEINEDFLIIRQSMLWNILSTAVIAFVSAVSWLLATPLVPDLPGIMPKGMRVVIITLGAAFGAYVALNMWSAFVSTYRHAEWKILLSRPGAVHATDTPSMNSETQEE